MLLTPPPLVKADTTRTSPSACAPSKSTAPPVDEQLAGFWTNQKATLLLPLSTFFSSPKYRIWSPSSAMNCAAYAFTMSILLLTLLSLLHCQSGMSRVSLDPVANVLKSTVQNVVAVLVSEQVPFLPCLLWKSRTNAPSLKPVVASKSMWSVGEPVAVNRVSQSSAGAGSGVIRIVLGNARRVAVELEVLIVDRQGGSGGRPADRR